MPGIRVEGGGKSTGERIFAPGLGQSDLRCLKIFRKSLNEGGPGSTRKGLDTEANSKGREIALEENGGKSVDAFFYAQMFISLFLVRMLESGWGEAASTRGRA